MSSLILNNSTYRKEEISMIKVDSYPCFESGVLIDDDFISACIWNHVGQQYQKKVTHYLSGELFLQDVDQYSKDIFIYVDWYLKATLDGLELTKKLSGLGFKNIVVTTNSYDVKLEDLPWVKAVIQKDPPWNLNLLLGVRDEE